MASAAFERFRTLVLADEDLQRRLQPVESWEPFVAQALELARERGVALDESDLAAAREAAQRVWRNRWNAA